MSEPRSETCMTCKYFVIDPKGQGRCYVKPPSIKGNRPPVSCDDFCSLHRSTFLTELDEFRRLITIPWDKRTEADQAAIDSLSIFFAKQGI